MLLPESILFSIFAVIVLLTAMRIFSVPVRKIFSIVANTALGFVLLAVSDLVATYTSYPVTLGFNFINAAVIGVGGLPGLGLLYLLKWLFGG